ncbi:hypothetical protein HII31_03012, partial [Pseudocercospora fuligena]
MASADQNSAMDVDRHCARVAAIYELLEMILVELPLKDLISSQATSRRFKLIFDTSEPIRTKFGSPFSADLEQHKWVRHPLLPKEFDQPCKELDIWTTRTSYGGVFTGRIFLQKDSEKKWSCPGSWKSFLACRPGTRSMRASSGCSRVFGSSNTGSYRYYRSESGITLGQLVDAACDMKRSAGVEDAIVHFDTEIELDGTDIYNASAPGFTDFTFSSDSHSTTCA